MHPVQISSPLPSNIYQQFERFCFGLKNAEWIPADQLRFTFLELELQNEQELQRLIDELDQIPFHPISIPLSHVQIRPKRKNQGKIIIQAKECSQLNEFIQTIQHILTEHKIRAKVRPSQLELVLGTYHQATNEQILAYLESVQIIEIESFNTHSYGLFKKEALGLPLWEAEYSGEEQKSNHFEDHEEDYPPFRKPFRPS